MSTLLDLAPRTTGELLDRALGIYRVQFKALFKVALVFELVLHGLSKGVELLTFAKAPALLSLSTIGRAPPVQQLTWLVPLVVGWIALSLVVFQASVGAVSLDAAAAQSPQGFAARACWARLRPRLGALIYTLALELVLLGLQVSLGLLPLALGALNVRGDGSALALVLLALGAGLSLLLLPALFVTGFLRYLVVPQVVVAEGLSGRAALARSVALMRPGLADRFWSRPKLRASLVLLVLGLVLNAVTLVADLPHSALLLAHGGHVQHLSVLIASEALSVFAKTAVAPFAMVALALFHLDLRVRREGLDLALQAERLERAA